MVTPESADGAAPSPPEELRRGVRFLVWDAFAASVMGTLTGGAFLVAFALHLGASNTAIGFLAAVGPLSQALQLPAVALIDRASRRRLVVVAFSAAARMVWLGVALLALTTPQSWSAVALLAGVALYYAFNAVANCGFSSWIRDLVPRELLGRFTARRQSVTIGASAVVALAAAAWIDAAPRFVDSPGLAYLPLYAGGGVVGLLGLFALRRVPDWRPHVPPPWSFRAAIMGPLHDERFRPLLLYLGWWKLAVNLATPFFTVYLLRRLGMSMVWVLGLSVLNQLTHVAFLRLWGRLADRYTNKSVLLVAGPLFILGIVLWPFTTMPEQYILTVPLLVVIHVLAGISTAGVTLATANIALKLAPDGQATSYLAVNAVVAGIAATIAPLIAGPMGDYFAASELAITLRWAGDLASHTVTELPALNLRGLDFLFIGSGLVGLFALHRLLAVREEGEVEREVVLDELFVGVRKAVRHVSNVAGLRQLTTFPVEWLRSVMKD